MPYFPENKLTGALQMKDYVSMNFKVDSIIAAEMEDYSEKSGLSKTALMERAVAYYIRTHELEDNQDLQYIRERHAARTKKKK